jgi:hypothetical protein
MFKKMLGEFIFAVNKKERKKGIEDRDFICFSFSLR